MMPTTKQCCKCEYKGTKRKCSTFGVPHKIQIYREVKIIFFVLTCLSLFSSCETSFEKLIKHKAAGDEAYQQGNYVKAEEEYQDAIKEAEKINHDNTMLLICLRSLAQVYIAQNRFSDAETIYKKRISLTETTTKKDPIYQATVYDDLATFYILQGRIKEAEPLYRRAVFLTEEAYGPSDLMVAEKLEYYAELLKAKGYDVVAAPMDSRAMMIRKNMK